MDIQELYGARKDLPQSYIDSILLNESLYLQSHDDVRESGLSAAYHFINHGIEEGRDYYPSNVKGRSFDSELPDHTMYYSNERLSSGSFKYRCIYASKGVKKALVYDGHTSLDKVIKALFNSRTLIFSRPENKPINHYIFTLARLLGLKVILDYDDLVLPEYSRYLGHVRSGYTLNEHARLNCMIKTRFFHFADLALASTPLVKEKLEPYFSEVSLLRNKLPTNFFLGDNEVEAKLSEKQENKKVRFLYMSGTATHGKDFSVISGPLIRLCQERPKDIELVFLGETKKIDSVLLSLGVSFTKYKKLSFEDMLDVVSTCDVCLVPLENTLFNNAKSNIKFIESASQGVPVVASATQEYKYAIEHNKNGWLCSTDKEWYKTLNEILDNKVRIKEVAINAHLTAKKVFSI